MGFLLTITKLDGKSEILPIMKTMTFTSRTFKVTNGIYLLILLLPLIFQSCATTDFSIQGSIDGNKQTTSGPSYPNDSPTGQDIGYNVGAIFVGVPDYLSHISRSDSWNYQKPGTLYAYNTGGPSPWLADSADNSQETMRLLLTKAPDNFVSHLTYMGGLEFVSKRSGGDGSTLTLNYLEVPLYGLYQTDLLSGHVFGGLGPYVAYGIGGNASSSFEGHSSSIPAFGSTGGFKRFDAGLGFTAGYKIPDSFYFSLAYSLGLANIDPDGAGDKTKNYGISLNVGYPIDKLIKRHSK